jgi:hypothetical protein
MIIQPRRRSTAGEIINLAADRDAFVAIRFDLPKTNSLIST